jgi:hypothetical protein
MTLERFQFLRVGLRYNLGRIKTLLSRQYKKILSIQKGFFGFIQNKSIGQYEYSYFIRFLRGKLLCLIASIIN